MKTFVLQLFSDMRVVVEKRKDKWEVWPQKFKDGKWNDHAGDAISVREEREHAMMDALMFSQKLLKNIFPTMTFKRMK